MPKVIAILNQKGGVGKTTLAVHIATALARSKRTVLLLDADPQASALDWAAARHGEPLFPVVGLPKNSIHKELPALAGNFDFVIIDGPPRVYNVAQSAIMASDLVLVPVQPSPYDVWAAKEIIDLMHEATGLQAKHPQSVCNQSQNCQYGDWPRRDGSPVRIPDSRLEDADMPASRLRRKRYQGIDGLRTRP